MNSSVIDLQIYKLFESNSQRMCKGFVGKTKKVSFLGKLFCGFKIKQGYSSEDCVSTDAFLFFKSASM